MHRFKPPPVYPTEFTFLVNRIWLFFAVAAATAFVLITACTYTIAMVASSSPHHYELVSDIVGPIAGAASHLIPAIDDIPDWLAREGHPDTAALSRIVLTLSWIITAVVAASTLVIGRGASRLPSSSDGSPPVPIVHESPGDRIALRESLIGAALVFMGPAVFTFWFAPDPRSINPLLTFHPERSTAEYLKMSIYLSLASGSVAMLRGRRWLT